MRKIVIMSVIALGLAASLGACSDPYDPGQRALGGGVLGAGAGAAVGGLAGGGGGALTGALLGGAVGAVGGAATTPEAPMRRGYPSEYSPQYAPQYAPEYAPRYAPQPGPYRY